MTRRRGRGAGWSGALAIAIVLWAGAASARVGSAEPSELRHAALRIDTSHVGDAGPVIKRRVEERGGVVLRDAEILPARDGRDAVISVMVEEIRGEDPGFVFEMWVERGGLVVGERRRVECTLCTESEIVARIEEALVDAAAEVRPDDGSTTSAATTGDDATTTDGTDTDGTTPRTTGDQQDDGDRRGLGGKGKAGVALVALGGAGVAVGLGLMLAEPRVHEDDPRMETSTRNPGIGVLAGAGVALVTGAVLLGLDRRAAKERRTAWVPLLAPSVVGLGVHGRF